MNDYEEKCDELAEQIYDYLPGNFWIDFDAGYSAGNGKARFIPFADADRYLNDSNYDDMEIPGYEYREVGDYECHIDCWLDISKNRETGELSFAEEVDWDAYLGDYKIDQICDIFTDRSEPEISDLVFELIDLQCRDTLGKSLDELLDGPEIRIPPKKQ